jgi:hypothetical protein
MLESIPRQIKGLFFTRLEKDFLFIIILKQKTPGTNICLKLYKGERRNDDKNCSFLKIAIEDTHGFFCS